MLAGVSGLKVVVMFWNLEERLCEFSRKERIKKTKL